VRCGFGARFWSGGEFVSLVALLAVPLRLLLACSSFGGLSPSGLVVHEQAVCSRLSIILQNGYKMAVCSRLKFLVKTLHALKMDKNKD